MMRKILKDNKGITMGETLVGFLIICIAIIMLTQCILLATNTIARTRKDTEDTQQMVKEFWRKENPDESSIEALKISDGKGFTGSVQVQVDTYNVTLEANENVFQFYEFAVSGDTDNSEGN